MSPPAVRKVLERTMELDEWMRRRVRLYYWKQAPFPAIVMNSGLPIEVNCGRVTDRGIQTFCDFLI